MDDYIQNSHTFWLSESCYTNYEATVTNYYSNSGLTSSTDRKIIINALIDPVFWVITMCENCHLHHLQLNNYKP